MDINEVKILLNTPQNIVITTHDKPDGDAMGSSLGLYAFLKKKKHRITVLAPSDYPDFLKWMPNNDDVVIFTENKPRGAEIIGDADLIFCLDYNALHRTNGLGNYIRHNEKAKKILIDHHLQPEPFADFMLSDTSASSTCELICDFIKMLGGLDKFDEDMASCLYAGLLTDTGRFKHSMSPKVHQVAGFLLEKGADTNKINGELFDSFSENRLRFLGHCLRNLMEVIPEYNTAIIKISQRVFNEYNHQTGDSEGLVNYPLGIKGIKFAALITEGDGLIKLSLRSKGDFSVNEFARNHWEGGGHKNAAGGRSRKLSLDRTVERFKKLLPQYVEELGGE